MKLFHLIVLSTAMAICNLANATILCSYAAYTPASIQYFLTRNLSAQGFAIVPAPYFGSAADGAETAFIVRDGFLLGSLKLHQGIAPELSVLEFKDASGMPLAASVENISACSSGICRTSLLRVQIGGTFSTMGVRHEPGYPPEYFLLQGDLEHEMNVTLWRSQFDEHLEFIKRVMLNPDRARPFSATSRQQSFAIMLLSDPEVAPYMPLLRIYQTSRGNVVVSGRTNQFVYDRIISQAITWGFYDIEPNIVIDSGIRIAVREPTHDLLRCL